MLYVLPANPASPKSSLKNLRESARRAGYLIAADYTTGTFTLVDARLRVPLLAHAIVLLKNSTNSEFPRKQESSAGRLPAQAVKQPKQVKQ